jgi:hypothetical protein
MTDMGRLEPFAMVSFRPETAVHWSHSQWLLTDEKAAVRTTLLKPPPNQTFRAFGGKLGKSDRPGKSTNTLKELVGAQGLQDTLYLGILPCDCVHNPEFRRSCQVVPNYSPARPLSGAPWKSGREMSGFSRLGRL